MVIDRIDRIDRIERTERIEGIQAIKGIDIFSYLSFSFVQFLSPYFLVLPVSLLYLFSRIYHYISLTPLLFKREYKLE